MNKMESLTELFRIGCGPSSSHTIGPERACRLFAEKNPDADRYVVTLYGSLAKTGKGHCTDAVIIKTFLPKTCDVIFDIETEDIPHPNTMRMSAYIGDALTDTSLVMSVGGGKIVFEGEALAEPEKIYPHSTLSEIIDCCEEREGRIWQYVEEIEGANFREYMNTVWATMKAAIKRGLKDEGILPGGLNVSKRARQLYSIEHVDESQMTHENRLVSAYAFAVGEQNACGETIVTAPTCGASGVLPAVLYYYQKKRGFSDDHVVNALMTAGIVGNIIKTNASISGAECGCQAEVGTACAMAAAGLSELLGLGFGNIEYSAEVCIEHHLGLTCDPICGLVQIPCIERNAVAAMRAINAVNIASFLSGSRKISFDSVVQVMKKTGLDISHQYKETSEAGLAELNIGIE